MNIALILDKHGTDFHVLGLKLRHPEVGLINNGFHPVYHVCVKSVVNPESVTTSLVAKAKKM